MLPKKAINQFKQIYKNKFGIVLTFDEATTKAENFLCLYDMSTRLTELKNSQTIKSKNYEEK